MSELAGDLADALTQLRILEREIKEFAVPRGIGPFDVKDSHGKTSMMDIVVAKAHVLSAMVTLEQHSNVNTSQAEFRGICRNCGNDHRRMCKPWCSGREIV